MKFLKVSVVLFFFTLMPLVVQSQTIVGTWKISFEDMLLLMPEEEQKMISSNPQEKEFLKQTMERMQFIFESNGTMKIKTNIMGQDDINETKWQLNDNILTSINLDSGEKEEIIVKELSSTKLILYNPKDNSSMSTIVFLRADK